MNDHFQFKEACNQQVIRQGADTGLAKITKDWVARAAEYQYPHHFEWLGRPIIRHPQDIVAMQQLIWEVQPELIIETGIARGGSLMFFASMLELLACCGANADGVVLGIDSDIPEHIRSAILSHPMAKRVRMFQGVSISATVADEVRAFATDYKKVMVCLNDNHAHPQALELLKLYAPLVSRGSYCVVFGNAATATFEYLQLLESSPALGIEGQPLTYQIDKHIENRVLITAAPDGFLQRI